MFSSGTKSRKAPAGLGGPKHFFLTPNWELEASGNIIQVRSRDQVALPPLPNTEQTEDQSVKAKPCQRNEEKTNILEKIGCRYVQ